jgi:hypothetical protein
MRKEEDKSRACSCGPMAGSEKCAPEAIADTSHIRPTTSTITLTDRWDHFLARWGYRRNEHKVEPGLYALGNPTLDSPVFVTANYTLSFDALRSALDGIDGTILVLNTYGINVWCAAGKGTFGTDELVHRIEATGLRDVVNHRVLILPQLGATGVAAHEVKKRAGFKVEYGPVRAADLPEYLKTHQATPEMRRVRFTLWDRMVLIPVELVHNLLLTAIAAIVLFLTVGPLAAAGVVAAVLAGIVLFPILLPWIPTRDFSSKGFILGGLVALPFALGALLGQPDAAPSEWRLCTVDAAPSEWRLCRVDGALWLRAIEALAYLLGLPTVTAFLALNFTGATTFTSPSGVRREMLAYIPVMACTFGTGIVLTIAFRLVGLLG